MQNEKLILDKLIEISATLGDHGSQLQTINKTLNDEKKEVSEISKKLDEHLLEDSIEKKRNKIKKGTFRRKQDIRLIVVGLAIAVVIPLFIAIIT